MKQSAAQMTYSVVAGHTSMVKDRWGEKSQEYKKALIKLEEAKEELLLNGTPEEIAIAKAEMAQEAAETTKVEEKEATTTKTPGFNCRIAIFFQSDKNGRKCAYYWSGRLGDGRAIRMKLAEAENLVAQGQADLLPCHPLKAATQKPEQVVEVVIEEVKVVEQEERQAMAKTPTIETPTTAIELYNLSNEFNNMRQSAKKRTIATMLENMACEHGYITIEGKMYHFNGDKLTRNYHVNKCLNCHVVCCTCGEEKPVNAEGECNDCASLEAIEEIVVAKPINEEIATVAESLNLPVEEVAKVFAIAQEYKQLKQADRETFEAESRLETVPSDVQAQERQVVRIEKQSDFSMCGTSWFYAHPECFSIKKILQRDNTDGHRYTMLSHREVGSRAVCSECGTSIHETPI